MITIEELHIYPLKSARAIALPRAQITAAGLAWDRCWMAVDARGGFLSQRVLPPLARIVPELSREALTLRTDGLPPLAVPLEACGESVAARIWKHAGTALDQGPEAAAWLSQALGVAARLVRSPPDSARRADPRYAGEIPAPIAFPDGFPLLVCNRASLDDLNGHLPQPVPMDRFRPNVVVAGLPAFAEDRIERLHAGAVTLRLVKPCTRCVIPSIDQITGLPGSDPSPVLRARRFDRALRGVTFGENAVIEAGAGQLLQRGSPCSVDYEP